MRFDVRAAVLAAFVCAACGGGARARPAAPAPSATPEPPAAIQIAPDEPIVIGVSVPLGGDQAQLGRDIADAAALGAADYAPAVRGHRVEVRAVDDGCNDAEKAAAAARTLAAVTDLAGVVGPMCTTGLQAAGRIYERGGIPYVSPSVTRSDVMSNADRFGARTAWRDDAQAAVQAAYARDTLAAGSAAVIDDSEPYGRTLGDAFARAFEERGGTVSRERIERGTADFSALADRVQTSGPDVVVFAGLNPEGLLFLKALRDGGYRGTFISGDGLLSSRDFIQQGGAVAEGAVLTGGIVPDAAFVLRFAARTGRVPSTPFVVQSHDAVTALLMAIDRAADGSGGALTIDRARLATELRQTSFTGLTGAIAFDERGDRRGSTAQEQGLRVYRVENGAFVPAQ